MKRPFVLRLFLPALAAAMIFSSCAWLAKVRWIGSSSNKPIAYAGDWTFTAAPRSDSAVPGCSAQWGPFVVPISVSPSGNFNAGGAVGSVSASGKVSLDMKSLAKDLCAGGSGGGNCLGSDSCRGSFHSADGSDSSWSMRRRP
ncbi:MAG: hypothetical protein ACYCPQ_03795 [Elusimicrobiota bacterium]